MKWLTLEKIKDQLRLEPDYTLEDDKLTGYGNSAEQQILNLIGCRFDDLIEEYGEVPAPLVEASLMLVDNSYNNPSPSTQGTQNYTLYGLELKVKPYIKL